MAEHRGVEYAIRWKDYGWEWEVFAHPGDPRSLVHGTVVSRSQNLADDEWRQIAVAGVEATVDVRGGRLCLDRFPPLISGTSAGWGRGLPFSGWPAGRA